MLGRIRELALAGPGWDGADGQKPTEAAIEDAERFVRSLPGDGLAAPVITLANDGEINFLWRHEGNSIDLGFHGTGTFSYYARARDGGELFGDDVAAASGLPPGLLSLLRVPAAA